jgi:hypothetical protein
MKLIVFASMDKGDGYALFRASHSERGFDWQQGVECALA